MEGYEVIQCHSRNRHTEEITIHIIETKKYAILLNVSFYAILFIISIEVYNSLISEWYRSPSISVATFLQAMELKLENVSQYNHKYSYIMGDFNKDIMTCIMSKSFYWDKLFKQMENSELEQ